MSDLVGNHIAGFPTRWLSLWNVLENDEGVSDCAHRDLKFNMSAIYHTY